MEGGWRVGGGRVGGAHLTVGQGGGEAPEEGAEKEGQEEDCEEEKLTVERHSDYWSD